MSIVEAARLEHSWPPQRIWLGWPLAQASFTKAQLAHALAEGMVEPTMVLRHYRLTALGKELARMERERESPLGPLGSELFSAIEGYDDIKKALKLVAKGKLVNVLLEGPPSSLRGDTRVWVRALHGSGPMTVKLEDLPDSGFMALGIDPVRLKAVWNNATRISHPYQGAWVAFTCTGGATTEVTANHSLLRWSPELDRLVPTSASDLREGDLLPIQAGLPHEQAPITSHHHFGELHDELGFLVGMWLADGGSFNDDGITLSKQDKVIRTRCLEALRPMVKGRIDENKRGLIVWDKPLWEVMRNEFLFGEGQARVKGRTSRYKCLPDWVHVAPLGFAAKLLFGYFTGDGTVSKGIVSATTTSPRLAYDMALLLTRFGICPLVRKNREKPLWDLTIAHRDGARFVQEIGSFRDAPVATSPITHDEAFNVPIPWSHADHRAIASVLYKTKRTNRLTRESALALITRLDATVQLDTLLNSDIRWVKVRSVQTYQREPMNVYDLSIEGCENFTLENRLVVHNTSKSLFLLDLERVPNSHLIAGSRVTAAGLSDAILLFRPKLLLLDEIEKMQVKATSVLLSIMETGLFTVTKHGQHERLEHPIAVVAACNSSAKLPAEMRSRFGLHLHLKPYTGEQFMQVCTNFLLNQERVALPVALRIAANTWSYLDKDIRTARTIARMLEPRLEPGDEDAEKQVDEWTQFLVRYGTAQ